MKYAKVTSVSIFESYFDLRQELLASLVSLQFVDVLHEDPLVFENISLSFEVQVVVPRKETIKTKIFKSFIFVCFFNHV